jgi:hypothetical protein
MLRLTRFEGENSLYEAVARDPLLGGCIRYAEHTDSIGRNQEMLHLPWEHWPGFMRRSWPTLLTNVDIGTEVRPRAYTLA